MLEKHIHDDDDDTLEKINELNRKSEKLDQKYDNLVEMRMNGVNVSVRTAIAREIVSNLLVHREFKSAFPAKLIIEKDKIWTENWSKTQWKGRINLENFTPYPKNPIIAKFFVNIGYADSLGSGVRNLYKFTKIYSDAEPDFEENDVFRLTVPMRAAGAKYGDAGGNERNELKDERNELKDERNEPKNERNELENNIIELVKDDKFISQKSIHEKLNVSLITIRRTMSEMQNRGILQRVGSKRGGYWKVLM